MRIRGSRQCLMGTLSYPQYKMKDNNVKPHKDLVLLANSALIPANKRWDSSG